MRSRQFSYNDLLVDSFVFSEQSCLNNIVYGVDTGCEVCEGYFNRCLFDRMQELLMSAQLETENYLGYALKSRYVADEVVWDGRSKLVQLSYPNLEVLNVTQERELLFNLPISPFLIEGVITTSTVDGCEIEVPIDIVENPDQLIFWNNSTRVKRDEGRGIRKDSGNWVIPLIFKDCGAELNVAHCNLVFVDIPTDECEGEIQPVIDGKDLPAYKIEEDVSPDVDRYWFYIWTLVQPTFFSANFNKFEYWKLHEELEVYCLTEVEQLPEVFVGERQECCNPTTFSTNDDGAMFEIIFSDTGVVYIQPTDLCVDSCNHEFPIKFKLYYKVSDPTEAEMDSLKQMISYYVAAKLPLTACRCKVKIGFIETAQTPFTETIFFVGGGQKIKPKYGDFYGQIRYEYDLHKMRPFREKLEV